jgi:hypothetical protein
LQIFQSPWSPRSPKYEFELMEEQPKHTILTTLHATDADSTISEYQLIDGPDDNGNEYFEINNASGKQYLRRVGILFYFSAASDVFFAHLDGSQALAAATEFI